MVWKIVASRKSSTGFETARLKSRKSHLSPESIVCNFYDQNLLQLDKGTAKNIEALGLEL